MILSWHYLVCLSNIIRLAISFCESVSSYLYAFSHLRMMVFQIIHMQQKEIFCKTHVSAQLKRVLF